VSIVEVQREPAPEAFSDLIKKHYGQSYAAKGETIIAVWITQRDHLGNVIGFDIDTVPPRKP
jgi:hypothetical protein